MQALSNKSKIFKKALPILIGILMVSFGVLGGPQKQVTKVLTASTAQPGMYPITEFVDGDTIVVNMDDKAEKIRFIGVDTPETHDPRKAVQCFGQQAANFTKQQIGNNAVRLVADPLNTNRDRYGRLLRYVYLQDGRLLNAELIKQGYGFAYTGFPFEKLEDFRLYQQEAREAARGLWGNCNPTTNKYGGYTSNDAD